MPYTSLGKRSCRWLNFAQPYNHLFPGPAPRRPNVHMPAHPSSLFACTSPKPCAHPRSIPRPSPVPPRSAWTPGRTSAGCRASRRYGTAQHGTWHTCAMHHGTVRVGCGCGAALLDACRVLCYGTRRIHTSAHGSPDLCHRQRPSSFTMPPTAMPTTQGASSSASNLCPKAAFLRA